MPDKSIKYMPNWEDPSSGLDLLEDFTKRYGKIIQDSRYYAFRGFERDLHRLIQTFVSEAVKPMKDALVEVAMSTPGFIQHAQGTDQK